WNRVGGETNNTSAGWKDYDVSGTSGTGRYVRVNATAVGPFGNLALFDLEVYGVANNNVALNRVSNGGTSTASASSGANPGNAFDGTNGTAWTSTTAAAGQYLQADLGA